MPPCSVFLQGSGQSDTIPVRDRERQAGVVPVSENPRIIESEGWEKRGVFDEPRLSEICETYRDLGFEILLVEYDRNFDGLCSVCFDGAPQPDRYKVVYTRK